MKVTTYKGYKFAILPNKTQERELYSCAGAARFAYNWGIDEIKRELDLANQNKNYKPSFSHYELRKKFNVIKHEICKDSFGNEWWQYNSKEVYSNAIKNLSVAFKNFVDSKNGNRAGVHVGFPKYKNKNLDRDNSFSYTTDISNSIIDSHHISLPKISGKIYVNENIFKRITKHTKINRVTVSIKNERWYVSFLVEYEAIQKFNTSKKHVGVDLGIKELVTLSNGAHITGSKSYLEYENAINKEQQKLSRMKYGSKRFLKHRKRIRKIYSHILGICNNELNHITKMLALSFYLVTIEDLNIRNMVKNRGISKHVQNSKFGDFKRMLKYKCIDYGTILVLADRWFPSSKLCHCCGSINKNLTIKDRVYICENCGISIDRDINAAINLDKYGTNRVDSRAEDTINAR